MATVDTQQYQKNPAESRPEGGVTYAIYHISLSVSVSSGDIHRIGRIPHGAIPLDAIFIPGAALAANGCIAKFGTSASNELFFSSASVSIAGGPVRTKLPLGTAQQISLSDDKMPRYDAITMVNTATLMSVGFMGDLVVIYRMPGQTL